MKKFLYIINESPKKINEKITNVINQLYIKKYFLFNNKFM